MVLLAILMFFLSALPVFANVHICKFSSQTTADWVQVCNDSNQTQDLSTYTIEDSIGNSAGLNCFLSPQKSYSLNFSNYLNKSGDFIFLKNGADIIDCISYGDQNCISNDTHTPAPVVDQCLALTSSWENTADCSSSGTQHCIVNTSTPIPSLTPSPSPTVTSTSTSTSVLTQPSTLTLTSTPNPTSTSTPAISISIGSLPDSAKLGDSFSLEFNIQNANPAAAYYVKAFGGTTDNFSIQTQSSNNWYNFNSSWDSFSQVSTDSNGHIQSSLTVRAKPDQETGQYQLKIKLKQVDGSQEKESDAKEISIFAPNPSNTPTPTPTPTSTLVFTTPSVTPTRTRTPTPTLPAETAKLSAGPTSSPAVLGQTNISSPSSLPKSSVVATIAKILMALGTLMLLVPAVMAKIKKY